MLQVKVANILAAIDMSYKVVQQCQACWAHRWGGCRLDSAASIAASSSVHCVTRRNSSAIMPFAFCSRCGFVITVAHSNMSNHTLASRTCQLLISAGGCSGVGTSSHAASCCGSIWMACRPATCTGVPAALRSHNTSSAPAKSPAGSSSSRASWAAVIPSNTCKIRYLGCRLPLLGMHHSESGVKDSPARQDVYLDMI